MKKCVVCGRECKKLRRGMCEKHYKQFIKYGEVLDTNPRTKYDPNEIVEYEDYAEIVLYNSRCEEVARAIIDLEDVDKVKNFKWCFDAHNNSVICYKNNKNTLLHRLIMNPNEDMVVDHINHNRLDNRKSNLRICTQHQNCMNVSKRSNNTSGVVGVYWDKQNKKWTSKININKKGTFLGYFNTKEEAIQARQEAEIEYYGEYRNKDDEDVI